MTTTTTHVAVSQIAFLPFPILDVESKKFGFLGLKAYHWVMRKKIMMPKGRDQINDMAMTVGLRLPGTSAFYALVGFLAFMAAVFFPFFSVNETVYTGFDVLKMGWKPILYSGFSNKLLTLSWASNFLLLRSLAYSDAKRHSANPWFYFLMFLLSVVSLLIIKSHSQIGTESPQEILLLKGAYAWSFAHFCGFIANARALYQ